MPGPFSQRTAKRSCSWGQGGYKRTKGRKRDDHQERKAVWPGSSGCLKKPWMPAPKAKPDRAPYPVGDDGKIVIRRQFQECRTKQSVSTGREEVIENMEKEQLKALWKV